MKENGFVLLKSNLPLPAFINGKVRDTYDLGDKLLIVATDRISAFDVILPCGIPGKGRVLNKLSAFWFEQTKHIVPNHLIEAIEDVRSLNDYLPKGKQFDYPNWLSGRSMVVSKLKRIEVECVVRGYISGSAWAEYKEKGTISDIPMSYGLKQSQILPKPIFTPSTKGEDGAHDRPMSISEVENTIGKKITQEMTRISMAVYNYGRRFAYEHGIIIADTKFEFGLDENNRLILIDELLTPDSSRFWDIGRYQEGMPQDSYDKQPVRDWLENTGWNKQPPAPILPLKVIENTTRRYQMAYQRITGKPLS